MPTFRVEVQVTYTYEGEVEAEDEAEAREWALDNETEILSDWPEQREGSEVYVSRADE